MTAAQDHGCHLQIARLRWTSSRRSIGLYPSENGRCSQNKEQSGNGRSGQLESSATTQRSKIMVQYGRPSRSSWAKSVRSSFSRTVVGRAIWENLGVQWGMLFRTQWKRVILISVCGWHEIGWKETKLCSDVEKVLNKEVDLGERTSFLDHVYLGCTQRQCEVSQNIVDNYRTMFESRISAGGLEKWPFSQKIRISSWSYDMLVMQRSVWNDIVSWQTRLHNNSIKYLLHALMTGRNKICWRIVNYLLSNCSEMLTLGKNWTTRYIMVSKQARTFHNKMD